jgi:SAM-dependent methyltransferase
VEPERRYDVYNEFAWFYARGWGSDYHKQTKPVLEGFVFPRVPRGAVVLDLCCGSGDLSRILVEHGYRVTGLDGSDEMLAFARRHAPVAQFVIGDARDFHLDQKFDAVFSTFDSLNHILNLEELECVFQHVFDALAPEGLFVFDLNMEDAFRTLWSGSFSSVEETAVGITNGSYDPQTRLGRARITVFRGEPDGIWRRSDVSVLEKCYAPEEITGGLARAGFVNVEGRDAWEVGMRGDIALGREFFFAVRPPAR